MRKVNFKNLKHKEQILVELKTKATKMGSINEPIFLYTI